MNDRKTFLITGASSGLGEALADFIFRSSQHQVVSISRRLTNDQKSYDKSRFIFIPCDLSRRDCIESVFSTLRNQVHDQSEVVFISNAGVIDPIGKIGSFNGTQIERAVQVNVIAPILLVNYLLNEYPGMMIRFLNVTSGASNRPISGWSLYCSTKAAARMFFDVLSLEQPQLAIHSIDPGVIDTPMQEVIRMSYFDDLAKFIKLKDSGTLKSPAQVAGEIILPFL